MKAIYGKKLGMTKVFTASGDALGVTAILISPATVIRIKSGETDGYNAAVVGFGRIREKKLRKPSGGQFKKVGLEPQEHLREMTISENEKLEVGNIFGVEIFKPGEKVHVSGVSRGLGFQGVVRRHHFRGGPKTHGQSDRERAPGSIGSSSYPSRVFKGQRMAGHMGNCRVTVKNLKVVAVNPEQSLLLLNGPVPGHKNAMVFIRKAR